MSEEQTATEKQELFPLDAPERVISFRDKDTAQWYRHTLAAPSQQQVLDYYRSQTYREKDGGRQVDVVTPALKLYAALVRRVEGYRSPAPQRVSRLHRVAVVQLLERVLDDPGTPAHDVDAALDFVMLRAAFSPAEGANEMRWFTGLVHAFEPFTAEEDVEFSRELNRPVVVGGSRSGETIRPLRQAVLLKWYDKKIRDVQGYSVPLPEAAAQDPQRAFIESIAARMDPFHKLAAFERFLSGSTNIELPQAPEDGAGEEDAVAA